MISVLIPARGRPEHFRLSLDSLIERAARPDRVELLVRFDDDDRTVSEQRESIAWYSGIASTVIVGERWGYWRMHDYYNQLAAASHGDFLLVWNDDTEMLTQGWDEKLREAPLYSVQEIRRDTVQSSDCTIPVVSRAFYKGLGHLSFNAHVDSWLADVSWEAGVQIVRNDVVFHHHCLAAQERCLTVDVSRGERGMDQFKTEEQRALLALDAQAIRRLKEKK